MRKEKIIITALILSFAIITVKPCQAELFPYGEILSPERCYYESTIGEDMEPYVNVHNDYEMFIRKGKRYHRAVISMQYPEKKIEDDIIMANDGKKFYSLFYLRVVEDAAGNLVRTEEVAFYHDKGLAKIKREVLNKDFKEKYESSRDTDLKIKIPVDTYAPLMFDVGYRVGDLEKDYRSSSHMISRQGMLSKLRIIVDEVIEVETPLERFPCYKIVQTPVNLYMKRLKFFLAPPEFLVGIIMPKITFYYSVEKPHRLINYYGYKDFGPASLKMSQVGLLFEDYMDVRLKKIESLAVDDLASNKFLFERMEKYRLFSD